MGTILKLATHKLVVVILSLVTLGAVVGGGVALATTLTSQPEPTPAPKTATLPPELAGHFAALSEPTGAEVVAAGSADAATKTRLDATTQGIPAQFGLNASLAREVTYGGSHHIWLIPGSTGIGFSDLEAGSGGGGPIAHALAGTIILDVGGNENGHTGGGTVYGLAPNGNSTVVVHDANGDTEKVPVEHNVYIVTHPGAVSVELIDGAGKIQTVAVPK